jgi:hypothetical protein
MIYGTTCAASPDDARHRYYCYCPIDFNYKPFAARGKIRADKAKPMQQNYVT